MEAIEADFVAGKVTVECPSDFGDLLTDFSCYLSIVLWYIVRRLPLGRGKSEQDYPSYFKTTYQNWK